MKIERPTGARDGGALRIQLAPTDARRRQTTLVEQLKMRLNCLRFVAKNMAESRLGGKLELAGSPAFVAAFYLGFENPAWR